MTRWLNYEPDQRMRWGFGDVGFGLAAFFGVFLIAAIVTDSLDTADPTAVSFVVSVVAYAALVVVLVNATVRKGLRSFAKDFGLRFRPIDLLIGLGIGLGAKGMSALIVLATVALTGRPLESGNLEVSDDPLWIVLRSVLVTSILAPIVEELFFRGLALRSLRNTTLRLRPAHPASAVHWSVAGSALLFAGVHLWQSADITLLVAVALSTLVLGIANGYVAAFTGRLGAPIVAHIVFNGSAVVTVLLS